MNDRLALVFQFEAKIIIGELTYFLPLEDRPVVVILCLVALLIRPADEGVLAQVAVIVLLNEEVEVHLLDRGLVVPVDEILVRFIRPVEVDDEEEEADLLVLLVGQNVEVLTIRGDVHHITNALLFVDIELVLRLEVNEQHVVLGCDDALRLIDVKDAVAGPVLQLLPVFVQHLALEVVPLIVVLVIARVNIVCVAELDDL